MDEQEKQKNTARYVVCIVVVLVIFAAFGLRLIDWQIINGAYYREKSDSTNAYTVDVPATRGEILAADGTELAINITGYQVVFDKLYVERDTENDLILKLVGLFDRRGEEWQDILPIEVDAGGNYAFPEDKEKEAQSLKDFLRRQSYTTAEQCMQALKERYNCEGDYTPKELRDICSVRYNMEKKGYSYSTPYTFAESISQDMVSIVSENVQKMPGVRVETTSVRKYVHGTIAPHSVGTVGLIDDYTDELKDKGYAFNDKIGKSGVESAMENYLRGKGGKKVIEMTKSGSLVDMRATENAEPGNTVYLTIDPQLQQVANKSLEENVKAAKAAGEALYKATGKKGQGEDCETGAAVVLNVKTGAVLAAASYPNYDLSRMLSDADYYSGLLKDKQAPMFNRAFSGAFAPGSTFKPMVALAALQEGAITPSTHFTCHRVFNKFGPNYVTYCMGYHGAISLKDAVAKSCNVYFLETGYALGITNMNLYSKRFGLGEKTGVGISESAGVLAGPEYRKKIGGAEWLDGNTVQAAIGQSDNLFTPLQLANYIATIANDGTRIEPHIVDKVTNYARDKVIKQYGRKELNDIGVSQENIDIVKEAMHAVQEYGTGATKFGSFAVPIGAKTGTAENTGSDHVLFVCFAPFDDPEIALAVIVEHGAKSMYSNNIAYDLLNAYFFDEGKEPITKIDSEGNEIPVKDGDAASSEPGDDSSNSSSNASSAENGR